MIKKKKTLCYSIRPRSATSTPCTRACAPTWTEPFGLFTGRLSKARHHRTARFSSKKFFFSSRRRHTRSLRDWSSDVCSSDLYRALVDGRIDAVYGFETDG